MAQESLWTSLSPMDDERYSPVPWSFQVRLRRTLSIPNKHVTDRTPMNERSSSTHEIAEVNGHVHPSPYVYSEAAACVERRLVCMTTAGWAVTSLKVASSGES